MSSQLKSDTARTNGARSHGPKSPETRAISSQNALRHGFTACNTTLLKCENPDEFEDSIAQHFAAYHPAGAAQEALVNEMISARWRIRRLRVVETQLIDLEMLRNHSEIEEKYEEPDTTMQLAEAVRALTEDQRSLSVLSRYESRLFRMHDRAYRTLRELQRFENRGPQAVQPEPDPPIPNPGIALVPIPAESEIKNEETNPPSSASSRRETPQSCGSAKTSQPNPVISRPLTSLRPVTVFTTGQRFRRN
jgi:hypothetical protein